MRASRALCRDPVAEHVRSSTEPRHGERFVFVEHWYDPRDGDLYGKTGTVVGPDPELPGRTVIEFDHITVGCPTYAMPRTSFAIVHGRGRPER